MSKDITLAEDILAFGLLVGLQFVITSLSVRVNFIKNLIKAKPTLLLDKGEFLPDAMKSQRVGESEIRSAIRTAR